MADVEISYNGQKIAELAESGEKDLATGGKFCGHDIEVTYNRPAGGTEITDGIVVTARDANGYATAVDFYGTAIKRYQFVCASTSSGAWVKCVSITAKNTISSIGTHGLDDCAALTALPSENTITSIDSYGCSSCLALTTVNLPELTSIGENGFSSCRNIVSFSAPKIKSLSWGKVFYGCTGLSSLTIGSVGYGITTFSSSTFGNVTQSNLTITLFTTGANADTVLANARNGATGATIIIKASADTTYGGISYSAGETMITSEVA